MGILSDAINPLKRWWELYPEHEERARNLLSSSVSEDTPLKHKAWQMPLGLMSYVASPITSGFEAIRDEPIRDVMIGYGMDADKAQKIATGIGMAMDVAVPVGAAKSGATVSQALARRFQPNVGPVALTQNIIRREPVQKTKESQILPPWYSGAAGRAAHMGGGAVRAGADFAQMLVSPKAVYLFQKYGFSPSNVRDIKRDLTTQLELLEGPVYKKGRSGEITSEKVSAQTLRNQLHSRLASTSAMLRKFFPEDARREQFEQDLFGQVLPVQRYTTANQLSETATPIREVLDIPPQITDQAVLTHLNPFIRRWWGLEGDIALNAKPLQENPYTTITRTSAKEGSPDAPVRDFLDIWKQIDGPLSRDKIIQFAKDNNKALDDILEEEFNAKLKSQKSAVYANTHGNRKLNRVGERMHTDEEALKTANNAKAAAKRDLAPKGQAARFYDIGALERSMLDEGGYISVGGQILSADRMLAHVQNRLIIPKDSQEGVWAVVDVFRQGAGGDPRKPIYTLKGALGQAEKVLEAGSKYDFIAADMFPVVKRMEDGKYNIFTTKGEGTWDVKEVSQRIPGSPREKDDIIRAALEKKFADRPSGEWTADFVTSRAVPATAIGGAAAYDQYQRKKERGLLAPY